MLLLLVNSVVYAQDALESADLDAYAQTRSADIAKLWQEESYNQALVILRELYNTPGMDNTEYAWTSILYNMACAYSLLGNSDSAMTYLQRTIDAGFQDYDHLLQDSDLDPVRADARFPRLLATAKRASEFWDNPAIGTKYRDDLSEDEKVAGLAKLWMEIKLNFAHFDHVPELNWDRLFVAFIPRVKQTNSTLEYVRMLQEMCAKLKDGHTGITPPRELWPTIWASPDISTQLIEKRVIVTKVDSDSARQRGVQVGMEVLAIDGLDVKDYAARYVQPYISASTPQALDVQTYAYYLLQGPVDKPINLSLGDTNGLRSNVTLPRKVGFSWPPVVEYNVLPGNISYVEFTTFSTDSAVFIFDTLFNRISQSKGLIIDLRRNGGGNSSVGWDILGYLTDSAFATLKSESVDYSPQRRIDGRAQRYLGSVWTSNPNGMHLFKGPVVVLSSAFTGSAAEDFLVAFSAMHRGAIIGEPSSGSTGQPLLFQLPGGISARVCTKRCYYPDGKDFVGIGVQPDLVVQRTIEDLRQNTDAALNAAVKYIEARVAE